MNKKKVLKISNIDLKNIMGKNFDEFNEKILGNVRCSSCSPDYSTRMVEYTVEINDLNDLLFSGKCIKCGSKVNRYAETGENIEYVERIEKIKKRN